jgi:hypothetical protein
MAPEASPVQHVEAIFVLSLEVDGFHSAQHSHCFVIVLVYGVVKWSVSKLVLKTTDTRRSMHASHMGADNHSPTRQMREEFRIGR